MELDLATEWMSREEVSLLRSCWWLSLIFNVIVDVQCWWLTNHRLKEVDADHGTLQPGCGHVFTRCQVLVRCPLSTRCPHLITWSPVTVSHDICFRSKGWSNCSYCYAIQLVSFNEFLDTLYHNLIQLWFMGRVDVIIAEFIRLQIMKWMMCRDLFCWKLKVIWQTESVCV